MEALFICFTILCLSLVNIRVFAEPVNPQMVTFNTADGGRINALLYRNGDHAVVLGHGAVFNKESWSTFATDLSAKNFTVMAIDFRCYGKSKPGTNRNALYEDILGAVRYLREQGASKVSVVGASMGGNAAAKASVAAKTDEIDKL